MLKKLLLVAVLLIAIFSLAFAQSFIPISQRVADGTAEYLFGSGVYTAENIKENWDIYLMEDDANYTSRDVFSFTVPEKPDTGSSYIKNNKLVTSVISITNDFFYRTSSSFGMKTKTVSAEDVVWGVSDRNGYLTYLSATSGEMVTIPVTARTRKADEYDIEVKVGETVTYLFGTGTVSQGLYSKDSIIVTGDCIDKNTLNIETVNSYTGSGNNYKLKITCTGVKEGEGTVSVALMNMYNKPLVYKIKVNSSTVDVTGVEFTEESADIEKSGTYQTEWTVFPSDATDKKVTFESDDESVATVDEKGLITAVGTGSTTVSVITNDGGFTDTMDVNVYSLPEKVEITGDTDVLLYNGTLQLSASVLPEDADRTVTWSSNDEEIAIVDENGLVTALKPGNIKITATAVNGVSADYDIYVVPEIIINNIPADYKMTLGQVATLTATLLPEYVVNQSVTWSTDNWNVLRILNNGAMNAKKMGTATITVQSVQYPKAVKSITINVVSQAKEVKIFDSEGTNVTDDEIKLDLNDSAKFTAKVFPETDFQKVNWTTSDWNKVKVIGGVITAKSVTDAEPVVITAASEGNPDAKASFKVSVQPQTLRVEGDTTMYVGDSQVLKVVDKNGVAYSATWSTSDWNTIKVIGNTATAKKVSTPGTTVRLTATIKGTTYTAFIEINVIEKGHEDNPSIVVNPKVLSIPVGVPAIINAKVYKIKELEWSIIEGENIAQLITGSEDGGFYCLVIPTATGWAKIRVKDKDSDTYIDIELTVY